MSSRRRALACTIVLTAALTGLAPSTAAFAAVDNTEGLRVESSSTYTVDLAGGLIHVDQVIHLTNEVPDRVTRTYVERAYFSDYATLVLPGAVNVTASWAQGGRLPVSVTPPDGSLASVATIDLAPDLYYGGTKTVNLSYDVPEQPLRTGAVAQINDAVATFPLFTTADPGLGSVTVVLPEGLTVDVAGSDLVSSAAGGNVTYTASGIADPETWLSTVIARNDDALVEQMVFFDDIGVTVQGWPGDAEWLSFTSDIVERGLPALKAAIGRPWNVEGQLEVLESSTPNVYGYALYSHSESLIEVGDELDAQTTLHELAHAWFNGEAFEGRWIDEALAEEYASLAMTELGLEPPVPEPIAADSAGAVPLNEWADISLDGGTIEDQEVYGYQAAAWLAHALVEEIGAEGMSAAVNASLDGDSPYPAETVPSRLDRTDWRTFLDHLQGVGGSEQADPLFRELVVAAADLPLLDARTEARERYAALVETADGWAPPAVLRQAMADWAFDDAMAMVPQVERAFTEVDGVIAALATVDVTTPRSLRKDVERATDLDALDATLRDAATAADSLVAAMTAKADANPLARLGLLMAPVDDDLAEARSSLDAGAWDRADQAARDASAGLDSATPSGALLLLGVALILGTFIAGGLWLRRRPEAPVTPGSGVPLGLATPGAMAAPGATAVPGPGPATPPPTPPPPAPGSVAPPPPAPPG